MNHRDAPGGRTDAEPLRVLVVDDEPDLRLGLRVTFETEGYLVDHAKDGSDALNVIKNGTRPDVVLLDVQMPNMNGWECLATLKRHPEFSDIPVVMFTTKDEPRPESVEVEPDAYVERPIGPISLLGAVRRLLDGPRGRADDHAR